MKRAVPIITIVLHTCIFCMATQEQIYTIQDGKIISSPNFVKPMDDNFCDTSVYKMSDSVLNVQVGNAWYIIQVGGYSSELCEGDFNLIDIYSEHMDSKLYKIDYGILKMDETSCRWYPEVFMANYSLRNLSKNGCFIEIPLAETSKAIIFTGQCYRTNLDRMLIFVLTESDAELVFNLPMSIEAFIHSNDYTKIIVESNFTENGDTVCYGNFTMHSIYTQDEMLMFKDNKR